MATDATGRQPTDLERTYGGVLGKMAGVYLGRPVEGWTAARLRAEHGDVTGFLPGTHIPVADDDLSGAFTFVRALEDRSFPAELTPAQAGEAWLDHLIEGRTTLWWGGMGSSTEHTAYRRLAAGIAPPRSGSAATNGRRAAEQIGGRIFADAWGLVHPRDPARAARAARAAARVSHDGVAVDAAGMLAATVAAAFDGRGVAAAMARGRAELPTDSVLHGVVDEVRTVLAATGEWRAAHARLAEIHPYARYGGHCPLVPNETVVLLALMAAPDDLARALGIAVGCGWDTDCNAGSVGAVIGVALGPAAFATPAAQALRVPMNDRLFVVGAEGGESVTDALTVARRMHAYARRRRGAAATTLTAAAPHAPDTDGDARAIDGRATFDFALPGAMQGFRLEGADAPAGGTDGRAAPAPAPQGRATLTAPGDGAGLLVTLAPQRRPPGADRAARTAVRVLTPTFSSATERAHLGYALVASPTLYPGQTIRALLAGPAGLRARLVVQTDRVNDVAADDDGVVRGPAVAMSAEPVAVTWRVPATPTPIAAVGVEFEAEGRPGGAVARLLRLDWDGAPCFALDGDGVRAWRAAWVDAFDHVHDDPGGGLAFAHDRAGGWASMGGRAWRDVRLEAAVELPQEGSAGVFVRGRGARRRLALRLVDQGWRLVLEGPVERTLAAGGGLWTFGDAVELALEVIGRQGTAWIDGRHVAHVALPDGVPDSGAVGVVAGPGTLALRSLALAPAGAS